MEGSDGSRRAASKSTTPSARCWVLIQAFTCSRYCSLFGAEMVPSMTALDAGMMVPIQILIPSAWAMAITCS